MRTAGKNQSQLGKWNFVKRRAVLLVAAAVLLLGSGTVAMALLPGSSLGAPPATQGSPSHLTSDFASHADTLDWLQRLNELRSWAGLPAVAENPTWSNGCWLHAQYMSENNYLGHSEDAANPWYTVEGFDAARASNCFLGVGGVSAIDGWATAPFHAVGMLDPRLSSTGFGSYSADGKRAAAALDVIRGRGSLPAGVSYPVAWPGPGSTTSLTRYWGGETPDPLSGTGWTNPVGLPIIVQFQDVPSITESHVTLDGVDLPHIVITETTYSNVDPAAQQLGRSVLAGRHAIIIFPRTPLEGGRTYHASLVDSGRKTEWSFSTVPAEPTPPPTPPPTPAPAITGFAPVSGTAGTAVVLSGSGFTGASRVAFDGVAASFTVDSDVQITTTVPSGAASGTLTVTTAGGTATSATGFVVVVTPTLTLRLGGLTAGIAKPGRSLTARGSVTPTSLAGGKTALTVQRKKGTRWSRVTTAFTTISPSCAYRWRFRLSATGAYRVQASIGETDMHAAAATRWITFRVK